MQELEVRSWSSIEVGLKGLANVSDVRIVPTDACQT